MHSTTTTLCRSRPSHRPAQIQEVWEIDSTSWWKDWHSPSAKGCTSSHGRNCWNLLCSQLANLPRINISPFQVLRNCYGVLGMQGFTAPPLAILKGHPNDPLSKGWLAMVNNGLSWLNGMFKKQAMGWICTVPSVIVKYLNNHCCIYTTESTQVV